uniref:IF rod domain-containing protein n=1 Tax=Romanomermis culicivorax TaxID=13658 RepID=A0A915IRT5_ROMCU
SSVTSSSSGERALEYESEYRSSIAPRISTGQRITRTSGAMSPGGASLGGGRVLKIVTEMGSSTVSGITPAMSANAAQSFLQATEKEKKDMQNLNDRLGSYIERVKGLESQNRKLSQDLEELRSKWGKDTWSIKEKYAGELTDARKLMDDTGRQRAEIEVQIARLQDDINEFRRRYDEAVRLRHSDKDQIDHLNSSIGDANAEIHLLRQRFKSLGDELSRLNKDNTKLWDELQKARGDLDQETLSRIDFQNQVQTLMEELEFLRRVHDQEVQELQALLSREPSDTREFFKNELALAIRDIRNEYDIIAQQNKSDMESWYKLKVQEVQTASSRQGMESNFQREETKRMRDNIGDLRGKLADLESKVRTATLKVSHTLESNVFWYDESLSKQNLDWNDIYI